MAGEQVPASRGSKQLPAAGSAERSSGQHRAGNDRASSAQDQRVASQGANQVVDTGHQAATSQDSSPAGNQDRESSGSGGAQQAASMAQSVSSGGGSAMAAGGDVAADRIKGDGDSTARNVASGAVRGAAVGYQLGGGYGAAIGAVAGGGMEAVGVDSRKLASAAAVSAGKSASTSKSSKGSKGGSSQGAATSGEAGVPAGPRNEGGTGPAAKSEGDGPGIGTRVAVGAGVAQAGQTGMVLLAMAAILNFLKYMFLMMMALIANMGSIIWQLFLLLVKAVVHAVVGFFAHIGHGIAHTLHAATGIGMSSAASTASGAGACVLVAAVAVVTVTGVTGSAVEANDQGASVVAACALPTDQASSDSASPDATGTGSTASLASSDGLPAQEITNAQYIYSVMTGWGMSAIDIAGILGNWQNESAMDPARVQGKPAYYAITDADKVSAQVISNGIGLGQWTNGRNTLLREYAADKGANWWDMDTQLAFMLDDKAAHGDSGVGVVKDMIAHPADTAADAALEFHQKWEVSSDDAAKIQNRMDQASAWYARMSGWTADTTAGGGVTTLLGQAATGLGVSVVTVTSDCGTQTEISDGSFIMPTGVLELPARYVSWGGYDSGAIPVEDLQGATDGTTTWVSQSVGFYPPAAVQYTKMAQAAAAAGFNLSGGAYRPGADTSGATYSNHSWGLAIDISALVPSGGSGDDAGSTAEFSSALYQWMAQNAATYGWLNPDWAVPGGSGGCAGGTCGHLEPWHWEWTPFLCTSDGVTALAHSENPSGCTQAQATSSVAASSSNTDGADDGAKDISGVLLQPVVTLPAGTDTKTPSTGKSTSVAKSVAPSTPAKTSAPSATAPAGTKAVSSNTGVSQ